MGTLGTILMLLAFLGFFIGIVGVIKGSVKFIKLRFQESKWTVYRNFICRVYDWWFYVTRGYLHHINSRETSIF